MKRRPTLNFLRLSSTRSPLFSAAFALYKESFPKYEQRPVEKQAALMSNSLHHFNVAADEGALAGILLYWEGSGYVYIKHFALQLSRQGQDMGSNTLKAFCEQHPSVILEIDPLVRISSGIICTFFWQGVPVLAGLVAAKTGTTPPGKYTSY